MAILAIDQAW